MKKKIIFAISVLLGLSLLGSNFVDSPRLLFASEETQLVGNSIDDRYDIDSVIEIKQTDKICVGGKNYDINESILTFPSGLKLKSNSFSLNELGHYELMLINSSSIYYKKDFFVNGDYIKCQNENTEIEYTTLNNQFVQKGFNEGLSINAAENDFITFSKPINVYENNITKLIYFNLVQMDQKVKNIDIRLTDCYDPNNYIDILYKRGKTEILTYLAVSANGQRDIGLDKSENGPIKIDDENYEISPFDGTIMDSNNPISGNYNNFMFYLDTTNKDRIKVIAETDIVFKKCIVSELNNPNIYSYNFPGFTNGNVYLSIAASNYEGVESAKIEIAEVCGQSGNDLKNLIGKKYNDDNAPIFLSDLSNKTYQIRSGVPFKVPEINVVDDTGVKGKCDYSVWHNYDSNAKRMISVSNGYFTPEKLGYYTIVYSAKDYFDNVGVYRIDLVASSSGSSGINFVFKGLTNIEAGKKYLLNQYEADSLNGNVNVKAELITPTGNIETINDLSQPYLVKYSGVYLIKYIYNDFFYEGEYETTFNSVSTGKAIFEEQIIPSSKYYIKGANYFVDYINAYTYGNGEPVLANIESFVSFDGGAFVKCNRQAVQITGNNTVQFKYVANGLEETSIYSNVSKIVDVNYGTVNLDFDQYFQSTSFTDSTIDENGITLRNRSDCSDTIDFINKLYISAFSLKFKILENSQMDEFSVVLNDYFNPTNNITLKFGTIDGVSQFVSVNNEPYKYIETSWKGSTIELSYSSITKINLTLSTYNDYGSPISFNYLLDNSKKLTDQYFLLSFLFENSKVNDGICIDNIMKQKFDKYTYGDANSGIASITKVETVANLNDILVIPSFYYCDVLSPSGENNATLTVSQISPQRRTLTDTNGFSLNNVSDFYNIHKIIFDKYGQYQLLFDYVDGQGNKIKKTDTASIRPVISVIDEIAPTIKLNGSSQEGIVNKDIMPLGVEVSDNYNDVTELNVYYFVYNSKGTLCASIKQGSTFRLPEVGTYTVYVYCTDANGNVSYLTYTLNVKKGS